MALLACSFRNTFAKSPRLWTALRSSVCQRASFASSHKYLATPPKATAQVPKRNATPIVPSKRPPINMPPPRQVKADTPKKNQSAHRAKVLYEAGVTSLYRAPPQFFYLAGCYIYGFICIGGALFMATTGYWDAPLEDGVPWFVPVAGKLSMVGLSAFGMGILFMSTRHITAIDLVSKAGQGKMRVSVRRYIPLPLLKPRQIFIEPWELELPTRLVRPLEVPSYFTKTDKNRNIAVRALVFIPRLISLAMWSIFAGTRKIFTQEGFLKVIIAERKGMFQNEMFKIDTAGTFANGGRSLIEVATFNP